jgi:hypothetical protein
MAAPDISAGDLLIKSSISVAPSLFEQFATDEQYNIAPAVVPAENRVYADRSTQAAFDAFNAGAASVARMFFDSTFETEAFREKMRELAGRS